MSRIDFTEISRRYERDSLVQRAAAEVLLALLDLGPSDDVLDLGCGTGHLSRRLGELTSGRVLGVDPSPGMIAEASARHGTARVAFEVGAAEDLVAQASFDAIFCNSALQWFRDPARALAACRRALRPGGRMAVQAPARREYCPQFLQGLAEVARDPATSGTFARFRPPWLFLERAEDYVEVFRAAGFTVPFARIDAARSRHSPGQALAIFDSGAAAGYLNRDCYGGLALPGAYVEAFRRVMARTFEALAARDGQLELEFRRLYLLAVNTAA
jgi:ubiquinone/menaquinone biosynthesis C-methylase UbiE